MSVELDEEVRPIHRLAAAGHHLVALFTTAPGWLVLIALIFAAYFLIYVVAAVLMYGAGFLLSLPAWFGGYLLSRRLYSATIERQWRALGTEEIAAAAELTVVENDEGATLGWKVSPRALPKLNTLDVLARSALPGVGVLALYWFLHAKLQDQLVRLALSIGESFLGYLVLGTTFRDFTAVGLSCFAFAGLLFLHHHDRRWVAERFASFKVPLRVDLVRDRLESVQEMISMRAAQDAEPYTYQGPCLDELEGKLGFRPDPGWLWPNRAAALLEHWLQPHKAEILAATPDEAPRVVHTIQEDLGDLLLSIHNEILFETPSQAWGDTGDAGPSWSLDALYEVIGCPPDATDSELRSAYARRAKEVHPDHNPGVDPVLFQQLSSAYTRLRELRSVGA